MVKQNKNSRGAIGDWLHQQWNAWDNETGEHTTGAQLAEYLDIDRHVLNSYLNGRRIPTAENLAKIAARFGPKIYDLAGLARPDPEIKKMQEIYDQVPEEKRGEFLEVLEKFLRSIER